MKDWINIPIGLYILSETVLWKSTKRKKMLQFGPQVPCFKKAAEEMESK